MPEHAPVTTAIFVGVEVILNVEFYFILCWDDDGEWMLKAYLVDLFGTSK